MKVTFFNLQPFEAMNFRQCIASPTNLTTDCNAVNTRITGFADANGGGSTYFPVYAYGDDQLKNSVGTPIPCDYQHECSIVAKTNRQNLYMARISFAPSPDACPPVGPSAVGGSGSAAATRAMYRWSAVTCLPPRSLQISFTTHNEHNAYADFAKGLTEYGITGLGPYPPTTSSGGPTYKLAPLTASSVVLAYRAYDTSGAQITTLTLSPDIIARLFMGQINNFSVTPAITALNPGISFPPRTTVVARAEYNSETYILTSWLAAVAPTIWKPPTSPSSDIFPVTGIDLRFGERAAALDIVDPPAGFDSAVVYIGVLDSSTAAFYGLPTVKIAWPDGSSISANSDSILEAINDSHVAADGTLVPHWSNAGDPDAYPMPMLTYMIAPTNAIDPAKGTTLSTFLRYAVQDGQGLFTGVDGYVGLPPFLVQASLAIADKIPVPPPPVTPTPTPSPSPPPTALPSPSPSPTPRGGGTNTPSPSPASVKAASNSRIASLSFSQGLQLAAAARAEMGPPNQFVLPSLLALTLLLASGGIGLQLWAYLRARRIAGRPI